MSDGPILTTGNSGLPGISSGSAVAHSTSVPPAIAKLPPATVISGFIRNIDGRGRAVLQTALGDFRLHSTLPLKAGDDIVIRIDSPIPQFHARIIGVNGNTPQQLYGASPHLRTDVLLTALEPEHTAPQQPSAQSTGRPAATELRIAAAQHSQISARVLTPASAPPAYTMENGQPLPPLPTGTQVQIRLLGHNPPATQPASSSTTTLPPPSSPVATPATQPPTTAPSPPATAVPAPATASPPQPQTAPPSPAQPSSLPLPDTSAPPSAQPAPAGKPATQTAAAPTTPMRPFPSAMQAYNRSLALQGGTSNPPGSSPQPPTTDIPPATTNLPAGTPATIIGKVIGSEPSGILIKSPVGTLILSPEMRLPVGSDIHFTLTRILAAETAIPSSVQATIPTDRLLTEMAEGWPNLQRAVSLIQEHASPNIQQQLQQAIPSTKALGPGILFFLTALTGSASRPPLPENTLRTLDTIGESALVEKIQQEFSTLSRINQDRSIPWQSWFIPVHDGQELQQLRFFIHNQEEEQKRSKGEKRFVVELSLSTLGTLQVDGLFHKRKDIRLLDIILRHQQPLPEPVKQGIRNTYTVSSEIWGLQGKLQFSHLPEFPVHPLEEVLHHYNTPITA